MYMALKHSHMLLAFLTISLFWFRVILKFQTSTLLSHKVLKITPHVIDTMLLIAGISLAVTTGFSPSNSPWLATKIGALIVYILMGTITLKICQTRASLLLMAGVSTLVFIYMAQLAIIKDPLLGLF